MIIKEALEELNILDESLDDVFSQYYAQKFEEKGLTRADFDRVIAIDPTFVLEQDKMGTYGKWLVNLLLKGDDLSNEHEIKEILGYYHSRKNRLDKKDINVFKTVAEFLEYVHSLDLASKSEFQLKAEQFEGAKFICKNDSWEVYRPLTYEASKFLRDDTTFNGYDANWCTGWHDTTRYWRSYTSEGKELYIFMNLNSTNAHDAKYQVCVDTKGNVVDFRDARDESANFVDFLDKSNLYEALKDTLIGKTKAFKVCVELKDFNGKIKYSSLMSLKFESEGDYNGGNVYDALRSKAKIIIVDEGIRVIVRKAFSDMKALTTVVMPDSVTLIGTDAFTFCTSLTKVVLSKNIKVIPEHCFYGCSSLSAIDLPDSVIKINEGAFGECNLEIRANRHKITVSLKDAPFIKNHIKWNTVSESLNLNEALSNHMCAWFNDWLRKMENSGNVSNGVYSSFVFRETLKGLTDVGVDVSKMKVVNAPVPTSARNAYISGNYVCIYYLDGDKLNDVYQSDRRVWGSYDGGDAVFIQGKKDGETWTVTPVRLGWAEYSSCSKISKQKLLSACTKFAYIDLNDKDNMLDIDKIRTDRRDARAGSIEPDKRHAQREYTYHIFSITDTAEESSGFLRVGDYDYADGWLSVDAINANNINVVSDEKQATKVSAEGYNDKGAGIRLALDNLESRGRFRLKIYKTIKEYEEYSGRNFNYRSYDRQGYKIPSILDFKEKLHKIKRDNYQKTLENYKDRLIIAKKKLFDIIKNEEDDDLEYSALENEIVGACLEHLRNSIKRYKELLERLDYILMLDDEEKKNKAIDDLFSKTYNSSGLYLKLDENIKQLEKNLSELETEVIESLNK